MEKDFDAWNTQKKLIDDTDSSKTFHEREIQSIAIGENVGFEQNGKGTEFLRPFIVYKKFSRNVFLGIPLTRTNKTARFYASFDFQGQSSTAIISQVRLFDAKRMRYKIGKMSVGDYSLIRKKLTELIQ